MKVDASVILLASLWLGIIWDASVSIRAGNAKRMAERRKYDLSQRIKHTIRHGPGNGIFP